MGCCVLGLSYLGMLFILFYLAGHSSNYNFHLGWNCCMVSIYVARWVVLCLGFTYCFHCTWGVPYFLVTKSFEVVSLVGASGCTVVMVYLCDGEPDVPVFAVTRLEIVLLFYFALYWFHSLSNGGQFLFVVSLRGYWSLVNLFLLKGWVPTLVLFG